tara:strand:+ start:97 stop:1710 length:1614 start_codon:yes stop_codon:yes gene_type:complete
MPVITIEFDDLNRLLAESITPDDFRKNIPLIGADPDYIDETGAAVEFFPDRPDLCSTEGVARALRPLLGQKPGLTQYPVAKSKTYMTVDPSVLDIRPVMMSCIVHNVNLDDAAIRSLIELQEKLHLTVGRKRRKASIGVHDLSDLTPPFTYTSCSKHEPAFVPLHFDMEMTPEEILTEHPKGIDYAHLLTDFNHYPILTDAEGNVASLPPIINGALTTVTADTKDILLDVTGLDERAVETCLNIVATALVERGGEIEAIELRYPSHRKSYPNLKPHIHKIDHQYLTAILGWDPGDELLSKSFMRCGMDSSKDKNIWAVSVPAYRSDLIHPIDLVEESAIGLGYETLPKILPTTASFGSELDSRVIERKCRETMLGLGFQEVVTLTLSSEKSQYEITGRKKSSVTTLSNPVNEEYNILRPSLLPCLLNLLKSNKHRELPQMVFEVGWVVRNNRNHLSLSWIEIDSKAPFSKLRDISDVICSKLKFTETIIEKSDPIFVDGRCAGFDADNLSLVFGELHPRTLSGFELGYPAIGGEILW